MAVVNEAVAEVAEEVADNADYVAEVARSISGRDLTIGLVAGLVGGFVAGGFYINRRLRNQYGQIAEDEIAQMREHFQAKLIAMEGKPALDGLVKDLGYTRVDDQANPGTPQTIPPEARTVEEAAIERGVAEAGADHEETKNVFKEHPPHTDEWDYEVEEASRTGGRPYVIHVDEQHERDYSESTFTFYAGDDVLCDERDKVIDNRDEIVGDHNLDKFGHGSGDPFIVYVRNDDLAAEFEIVKSEKTYAEEVHGLSHGDYPRHRRPKFDDE